MKKMVYIILLLCVTSVSFVGCKDSPTASSIQEENKDINDEEKVDKEKDITDQFPEVEEIKKTIAETYSTYIERIEILITETLEDTGTEYKIDIDYGGIQRESLENQIKIVLNIMDEIDSLFDKEAHLNYSISTSYTFPGEPSRFLFGHNSYSYDSDGTAYPNTDRRTLVWNITYFDSSIDKIEDEEKREEETKKKKKEIYQQISDITHQWYDGKISSYYSSLY